MKRTNKQPRTTAVSTVLEKVLQRIHTEWTEDKYCAAYYAVDKYGYRVNNVDKDACKWCFMGILYKICAEEKCAVDICLKILVPLLETKGLSGNLVRNSDKYGWHFMHDVNKEALYELTH